MAKQFVVNHVEQSVYERLPNYKYDGLKKGTFCPFCTSVLIPFTLKKIRCEKCGYEEDIDAAVMRSVKEFHLLFPDRKITTMGIQEWGGLILSKKVIRRVLGKYLTYIEKGGHSHYLLTK
ncbi:hypothetical protein MUB24_15915 [Lederbergia sp. NSJ-179]|uniref:hypothetical protein n=1 Tax=Lederbergia sp. NSJ-179 TaxID=2931402 RepID=UPI001FD5AA6F|nr:hypothetical protein [Lederbergia sp. NSJ-179]MCJ7842355.1 hypothetical protein [Lederbergia sp. NSJ-179]